MPITIDAIRTGNGSNDLSVSVNVPVGSTAIIISIAALRAAVGAESVTIVPTAVSYNAVNATAIIEQENITAATNRKLYSGIHYILNPATGNNTFAVTFPRTDIDSTYTIYCIHGENQASILGNTASLNVTDTGINPQQSITTAFSNSLIIGSLNERIPTNNPISLSPIADTTEDQDREFLDSGNTKNAHGFCRRAVVTPGSYTVGWTATNKRITVFVLAEIRSASANLMSFFGAMQ